ncbi:MAG TPA: enoyl-CoA hydratase [Polyangiales bacterium]|nr:enoyl-CoA hydratase [Polyangiales bacterium]
MSSHISIERDGGVTTLRMDRPDKKNAITFAMYTALADALGEVDRDDSVRAVLLCGAGGNFTAGNDLGDFANRPPNFAEAPSGRFLRALATFGKPLVAAVDGNAIGIGVTMLLHCDLIYASDRAKLRMPFVDLGLVPEAGSSLLLPRLIGHQRASELLLLGEALSATTAHEIGLVNAVLPALELEAHAQKICQRLAAKAPGALRHTKALLRDAKHATVMERIEHEGAIFGDQLRTPEAREAISAFFEKRAPNFSKA